MLLHAPVAMADAAAALAVTAAAPTVRSSAASAEVTGAVSRYQGETPPRRCGVAVDGVEVGTGGNCDSNGGKCREGCRCPKGRFGLKL